MRSPPTGSEDSGDSARRLLAPSLPRVSQDPRYLHDPVITRCPELRRLRASSALGPLAGTQNRRSF
jgi:hypothetical protein